MDHKPDFQRSSFCASSCCLEVALLPGMGKVFVRNSQDPGTVMEFSAEEWGVFLAGAKNDEFDI